MTNFHDEPELVRQCRQVVTVAEAMLDGRMGIIAGSRQLQSLSCRVSRLEHDPDFLPFCGIDSETDHLPLGDVRQYWAVDALAAKDAEISAAETRFREKAFSGCRRLVERFSVSRHSTPNSALQLTAPTPHSVSHASSRSRS